MARDVAHMGGLQTDLPPDQSGNQAFRELNMVPGSAISMRPRAGTEEIALYEPLIEGRVIIVDALPLDPTNGMLIVCQNNRNIGGVMSHYTEFLADWRPNGQSSDFSEVVGTALGPKIYGVFGGKFKILDFLFGTYTSLTPDTESGFISYFPIFLRPSTFNETGYSGGTIYPFPSGLMLIAGTRTSPSPQVLAHVFDVATTDESNDTALQDRVTGASTAFNVGACTLSYPYNGFVFWWNDSGDNTPRVRVTINGNFVVGALSGQGTYGFTLTNADVLTGAQIADITPACRSRQQGLLVGKRSSTPGNYQLVFIQQPINLPLDGATTIAYTTRSSKEFLVSDWAGWTNRPDTCLDVQQIVLNSQVNAGRIVALLGTWVSPTINKTISTPRLALLNGTNQSATIPIFGDGDNNGSSLGVLNSHATGTLSAAGTQHTFASASAGTPSGSTVTWTTNITGDAFKTATSVAAAAKTTYVKATNFHFAIPSAAVIDYITVTVTRQATLSATSLKDNSAKLLIAGTPTGTDMAYTGAFWGDTGYEQIIYGGSVVTDWGIGGGLTGADLNASTFGFALSAINDGTDAAYGYVQSVQIYAVYDANSFHGHGMVADQHGHVYAVGTGDFVANEATYLIMKYDPRDFSTPVARVAHESNGLGDYYADPLDTHICSPMIDGAYFIAMDIDAEKTRLFIYDLSLTFLGIITNGVAPATDTGATAANVDNAGGTAWTLSQSPGRGTCSAAIPFNSTTDFLEITNFGFALPSGAIVTGVTASITRSADVASAAYDQYIKLIVSGSIAGDNKYDITAPWPTSSTAKTYGAFNSTWGNSLTRAIVNASNFGISISSICYGAAVIPAVQSVTLTVYYSTGETVLANKFSTKFFAQNY